MGEDIKETASFAAVFWDYAKTIIKTAVVVLVLLEGVFLNAEIPSGSMETTIMTGDRVFGLRNAYGINLDFRMKDLVSVKMKDPARGDIIIFRYPDDETQYFIKRIIGLPGETVEVHDGKTFVNGTALEEPYLHEKMEGDFGPYKVPEGKYFVMGDNRNNSLDSRYWKNTYVPFESICAKAWVRLWPSPKFVK